MGRQAFVKIDALDAPVVRGQVRDGLAAAELT